MWQTPPSPGQIALQMLAVGSATVQARMVRMWRLSLGSPVWIALYPLSGFSVKPTVTVQEAAHAPVGTSLRCCGKLRSTLAAAPQAAETNITLYASM